MDCLASPSGDETGRTQRIICTGVEVTDRRIVENAQQRLNRALRMLNNCGQILARATDATTLIARICEVVVTDGGYLLAWIGRARNDTRRRVEPVAWAGIDSTYIEQLQITWADTPDGAGPTGRAIREHAVQVCHDVESDPCFEPWRHAAQRRGYASSIALPVGSRADGLVLNIYSQRVGAFDAVEISLLQELAGNLAHGIRTVRATAGRRHAEKRLRLFRRLLDSANDIIYLVDLETGFILDANAAVTRQLGYAMDDLLRLKLTDLSVTAAAANWTERVAYARKARNFVFEGEYRRKDGTMFPAEISGSYVELDGHPYLITVGRDVSERRRQQVQIARLMRVSRLQAAVNAAVLRIRDREELLAEACRLATEVGGYDRAVVSIVEPDGLGARPRYRAGHGEDFPEPDLLLIGDGTEPDASLAGRALRTGEVAIRTDLTTSGPTVVMQDQLARLGYRSVIALPLIVEGHRLGVLTLASREVATDWDEELPLLRDMVATLSFALRAQRQAAEVQQLADFDPLTGLARRTLLCKRLDEALLQGAPAPNPLIAAFDVQQLTRINDTYGQHFGDLLLQQVAARLGQVADDERRIGYLGGGTFVLFEPEIAAVEESIAALLNHHVFGEPYSIEGRSLRVGCRSGLARYPQDGTAADTLVQKAEAALRHAKDTGESHIHYALELHSQIGERIALEGRLQNAIDHQQFEVYYQPKIGVRSGRIESVEALLRWNDPEHGVVAPAAFLPVLESTSLIVTVGSWVLDRALSDCRRWADLGLPPVRVAVNVSALQVRRRDFVPHVLELFHRHLDGRPEFGLDLEITETAVLHDLDGASRKLQELRDGGVQIALDDFGTGYSSLGLLSKLPVDALKIDRSFVAGLPDNAASVALVRGVLQLASAFGLVTVAEGVETIEQMNALRDMDCDQTQGYLHYRPTTAAQIEKLLRDS